MFDALAALDKRNVSILTGTEVPMQRVYGEVYPISEKVSILTGTEVPMQHAKLHVVLAA